jgi:hypothetical protein
MLLPSIGLNAQSEEGLRRTDALKLVFNTLMLESPQINGSTDSLLQLGAWEALSYLENKDNATMDDLQEAVPDYYHFFESTVLIKLINPQNSNEYSMEVQVNYKSTSSTHQINLYKSGSDTPSRTWQIIYLDTNYMALEMDGLRVFFTHAPPQE